MKSINKKIRLLSAVTTVSLLTASSAQAAVTLLDDSFTTSAVVTELLQFNDLDSNDWRATAGSNWTIGGGSLSNSGGGTNAQDEGGLGKLIDLTGIADGSLNQLTVNVDFTLANATEELFLHIRGFVGAAPASTQSFLNQNATAGNIWDSAAGAFDSAYTLNTGTIVNGSASGSGQGDAISLDDGVAGAHSYSQTFDLSSYAVNNIAAYDYLVVAFARDENGTSPTATIGSINIIAAVPEPSTYALLAGLTGLVFVMVRRRRA